MKRGRAFLETKNLLLDFSRSKLSAATCPGRQLRVAWPPTRTSGARSNRTHYTFRRRPCQPPGDGIVSPPHGPFNKEGSVLATSHITGRQRTMSKWAPLLG